MQSLMEFHYNDPVCPLQASHIHIYYDNPLRNCSHVGWAHSAGTLRLEPGEGVFRSPGRKVSEPGPRTEPGGIPQNRKENEGRGSGMWMHTKKSKCTFEFTWL